MHYISEAPGLPTAYYLCPNSVCRRTFMIVYRILPTGKHEIEAIFPTEVETNEVSVTVANLSPSFLEIYRQAKRCKVDGLLQVAGPGYRKSCEFLLKDYACSLVTTEEERAEIRKAFAGKVVDDFIPDPRIQKVARRALWLGNDETHYLRRWAEHDIDDLANLITLTMHWIEISELSRQYEAELTEKGVDGGAKPEGA
jgi:hypothetical protein